MKKKLDPRLAVNRVRHPQYEDGNDKNGAFIVRCPVSNRTLVVIISNGGSWDHCSVSVQGQIKETPTWAEMSWVRDLVWQPDEVVMQLHVPTKDHISYHDGCLHLWKPQHEDIPRPPSYMVYEADKAEVNRLNEQLIKEQQQQKD